MAKRTKRLKDVDPAAVPKNVGGKPSKYPGKNRTRPVQVYFTDDVLEKMEAGQMRRGSSGKPLSRPDYLSDLINEDDKRARG